MLADAQVTGGAAAHVAGAKATKITVINRPIASLHHCQLDTCVHRIIAATWRKHYDAG
jgi:hypothetical protein